jgi:hypothetical protein
MSWEQIRRGWGPINAASDLDPPRCFEVGPSCFQVSTSWENLESWNRGLLDAWPSAESAILVANEASRVRGVAEGCVRVRRTRGREMAFGGFRQPDSTFQPPSPLQKALQAGSLHTTQQKSLA